MSEIESVSRRGRLLGRWEDRVKEYTSERGTQVEGGGLEQAKKDCLDSEKWRLFCCGHLLGESKTSKTIYR